MTTTDQPTALARRELTLAQLAQRIDLNVKSGWGLEGASTAQLNSLALFCQRHGLLPGDEVTLYDKKPWITVDGRVTLMRRNRDEYRGHSQRPLSAAEKQDWGWDAEDIVVETTVRTNTYGDIKAYGRVSKAEKNGQAVQGVRHNPVAKHHPVEIAQKRSLSRGERLAFGTESFVDDEDFERDVRAEIIEQNDPERRAALAAKGHEVFGTDEGHFTSADRGLESAPKPAASDADEEEALAAQERAANLELDMQLAREQARA